MSATTFKIPDTTVQAARKGVESQEFKSAVSALAMEFMIKKPEVGKFDGRKDRYRAILINVVAALDSQDRYAEARGRAIAAGTKGIEIFTNMEVVCNDYARKAESAARVLLSDKSLASAAMAEYVTQRMGLDGFEPLGEDKRKDYREAREEIRNLTDQTAYRFNISVARVNGEPGPLKLSPRQ
ncbi:MAG: hypothetical protein KGH94_04855 [Candidatus Micrarchaeota archaeon]|nr:hypothetical protein [Candidatus Micrarchaeota archaeon]